MLGDFNLKFINWQTEKIEKPETIKQSISSNEKISSNILLDFVNENLLTQLVTENTRHQKSLLDLVFTNNEDIIFNVNVDTNNYDTDHDTVNCQLLLNELNSGTTFIQSTAKKPIDQLNFQKANWTDLKKELNEINWEELFKDKTVSEMYTILEKNLTKAAENHVPLRNNKNFKNSVPRNRLKLIRKRKEINARINIIKYTYTRNISESQIRKLENLNKRKTEIEEEMKSLLEEEMLKKEVNAILHMKKNPKYFYSFVKKFNQIASRIGPLKDAKETLTNDPQTKANILQDQYTKVFSNPNNINTGANIQPKQCNDILDISISTDDIISAIKDIPLNSAPGPDKIPAVLLKRMLKRTS